MKGQKQRERSRSSFTEACAVAQDISNRLTSSNPDPSSTLFVSLINAALERLIEPCGLNEQKLLKRLTANHIVPDPNFQNKLCSDIKPTDINNFLISKTNRPLPYSKSTLTKLLRILKASCKEGIARGYWNQGQEPTSNIKIPKDAPGTLGLTSLLPARIPSHDVVQKLIDAYSEIDLKHAVMVKLAAGSGLRFGELVALRPTDISMRNNSIQITRSIRQEGTQRIPVSPKTHAGNRTVFIPHRNKIDVVSDLKKLLTRHKADGKSDDDLLFTTAAHKPFNRSNWNRQLRYIGQSVKYHYTWHTLRHYAASRMLELGLTIADVSQTLGHANSGITYKLYVHGDTNTLKRMQKLL